MVKKYILKTPHPNDQVNINYQLSDWQKFKKIIQCG
jgi:hypothetical protein